MIYTCHRAQSYLGIPSVRPRLAQGEAIHRHSHSFPYATIVLEGGYEEAGEGGRWRVRAGDVLMHAPFSAHRNYSRRGALLLNLPIPMYLGHSQCGYIDDPEWIARLAPRDPIEASVALVKRWQRTTPGPIDTADLLASLLSDGDPPCIAAWSARFGSSRQTVFRQFRAAYGVGPNRYRVEARARRAWQLIVSGPVKLADIAAATGFADQAHMQRDVKTLTGRTPGAWRRGTTLQHLFNTREDPPSHHG